MTDEDKNMSREAQRVEEEYMRTRENRENGAIGGDMTLNAADRGKDRPVKRLEDMSLEESQLALFQAKVIEAKLEEKLLELSLVEQDIAYEERIRQLERTPQPIQHTPSTPPMPSRGARIVEIVKNRNKSVRMKNDSVSEKQPPRWKAEDVSPVVEPTVPEVARCIPPLPNYNIDTTGAIPRVPTLPSVPISSPHVSPTTTPVMSIPAPIPGLGIPQASPPSVLTVPSAIRPKDIAELKFEELKDISTRAKLNMFYEGVEGCVTEDKHRLEVANMRMDEKLRVLVHNAKKEKKITDWKTLKSFLISAFSVKLSFDQLFDTTNEGKYDWVKDPHEFRNDYMYKYSNMCQQFPDKELPRFEKMLKNKLIEGFPSENQGKLRNFMDKSVSLETFMTQVQRQREILLSAQGSNVTFKTSNKSYSQSQPSNSQTSPQSPPQYQQSPPQYPQNPPNPPQYYQNPPQHPQNPPNPPQQSQNPPQYPPSQNQPQPQPRHYRPRQQGSRPKYCRYCSGRGHSFQTCKLMPPYYVCFDCKRTDCRQGDPGCQGWVPHQYVYGPNGQLLPPPQTPPSHEPPPPPQTHPIPPPNVAQHSAPQTEDRQ